MAKRYFEFQGEDTRRGTSSSSKFWEVWVEDSTLYTRFGKIGAQGQTTLKEFAETALAYKAEDHAIASKIKKGYLEIFEELSEGSPEGHGSEEPFRNLVAEDTSQAWESVRAEWVNSFAEDGDGISDLTLVNQGTGNDLEKHAEVFETVEADRIWGEFNIEPSLYLGDDFFLSLKVARALGNLRDGPSDSWDLVETFVAAKKWSKELPDSATSFVVVNCPRCELRAMHDQSFDDEERPWDDSDGWIDPECVACGGIGEWEWSLGQLHGHGQQAEQADEKSDFEDEPTHCGRCARALPKGARFCSSCGEQVPPSPSYCSQCGALRRDGAKFCTQCGKSFHQ